MAGSQEEDLGEEGPGESAQRRLAAVAGLDEPTRRRLYGYVSGQQSPVSRDEAAGALGIGRSMAAFHLDKLADLGLLDVTFKRPPGRGGPGAGRPTKRYRRSRNEIVVSLPERRYELAASLMARAIETTAAGWMSVGDGLDAAAREYGQSAGREAAGRSPSPAGRLELVLTQSGYEPRRAGDVITLANCPFHALTAEHRTLVCRLNLQLLSGVCEAVGLSEGAAQLDPDPDRCCVTLVVDEPA